MGAPDPACPVCDADLILAGDEHAGDLVHCTYCGAPFLLRQRPRAQDEDEKRWELEEDF
jgi:DNA-directed RNA polymerase subunit RPC12/RpoP